MDIAVRKRHVYRAVKLATLMGGMKQSRENRGYWAEGRLSKKSVVFRGSARKGKGKLIPSCRIREGRESR